jgi:succinate dehydrogenase flavin-adding protein (antitoxin of CptAB toxin-antitoxin module)
MVSCKQKDKFMITEQKYLDAKKIIEQYEQEQLNIPLFISCEDSEYFKLITEKHKIVEQNLDMIVREFNKMPRIVEINKRIKELNISCS